MGRNIRYASTTTGEKKVNQQRVVLALCVLCVVLLFVLLLDDPMPSLRNDEHVGSELRQLGDGSLVIYRCMDQQHEKRKNIMTT